MAILQHEKLQAFRDFKRFVTGFRDTFQAQVLVFGNVYPDLKT